MPVLPHGRRGQARHPTGAVGAYYQTPEAGKRTGSNAEAEELFRHSAAARSGA
jgi:hypothetical protein